MTQNPQKSGSKSRVSKGGLKLQQDLNSIMNNALNGSSSKMQYSFPKSDRFNSKEKLKSPDLFYNIPDTQSKRACSFGYGSKIDFSKSTKYSPDPCNYNIKSPFDQENKYRGITMGAGRQIIKTNSVFNLSCAKNPGPSNYQPKHANLSHSYALRSRIQDHTDKWIKSTPGPGSYGILELTNKESTPVSKYESCVSSRFGRDKRKSLASNQAAKVPSVGVYQVSQKINATSKYYLSKGSMFPKGQRRGIQDKKLNTPGPGAYRSFSEFLH